MRRLFVAILVFFALCAAPACASGFDRFCNLPGFAAPVRQTIVVLDEAQIVAEPSGQLDPRNANWRHFLGNLLLPSEETVLANNFLPRERVTVLIARKDGSGAHTVFYGCMPFYSAEERERLSKEGGAIAGLQDFFGAGPTGTIKQGADLFRIALGNAIHDALDPGQLSIRAHDGSGLDESGLVNSLKQSPVVNLAYGIPRIIFYSDLTRFVPQQSDRASARRFGAQRGFAADLNLQGADVYVAGVSGGAFVREALEAFFLASRAELQGLSGPQALPVFGSAPIRVLRYQGLIQYPDLKYPIRIRLATDINGTVVDSWLSVQTGAEQFAPIHGVVTCGDNTGCVYSGDEVFAQIWNADRGAGKDPMFDEKFPFGGARQLSFRIDGPMMRGSISDNWLRFSGLKSFKLEFSATRQSTALF